MENTPTLAFVSTNGLAIKLFVFEPPKLGGWGSEQAPVVNIYLIVVLIVIMVVGMMLPQGVMIVLVQTPNPLT